MTRSSVPGMSNSALLAALKRESTYLEPQGARTGGSDSGMGEDDLFELGEHLSGVYEIQTLLGHGGMGQVFEAQDHMLERTVAVKASWRHIERGALLKEARGLAALAGHGVPAVFSMGVHRDIEYCVMERLYGKTLASHMIMRLADGCFEIDEVVESLIGVADALAEIHDVGLIHRDLKPANIMLAPGNRTVLFDFGLFMTKGSTGNDQALAGSPRYLAPEAIESRVELGQAHLLDIYSLGVIGFTLLTGQYPFNDRDAQRILWKHVHDDVPVIADQRPDVPFRLARLVKEMLAKEALDRPFSADAIAAELGTIRAQLPPPIDIERDGEIEPEDELAAWLSEDPNADLDVEVNSRGSYDMSSDDELASALERDTERDEPGLV